MDPVAMATLIAGLGEGLALALKVLAEKGVAEVGFLPLQELARRGWDARKDAAHLQAAFQAALDELLQEGAGDLQDRLYALPRLAGGGQQTFARLAAAEVEMSREDPQAAPA